MDIEDCKHSPSQYVSENILDQNLKRPPMVKNRMILPNYLQPSLQNNPRTQSQLQSPMNQSIKMSRNHEFRSTSLHFSEDVDQKYPSVTPI